MAAEFEPIRVLGMMSGTSMDGVDAAVLQSDGANFIEFAGTGFRAYSDAERDALRAVQGKWPGDGLGAAQDVVLEAHAGLAQVFNADLIGFHGQTLAHDPEAGRTHQLGDGAQLADMTARDVVWDFRTMDMEAGGQGAPLAPFFHFALAKHIGATEPVAFLNLGGVANVTCVDPRFNSPEEAGALLAFDTGPASALIDDFVSARSELAFDKGGALAAAGRVNESVLAELEKHPFLSSKPPKSLDRNDFVQFQDAVKNLSLEDGAATLTAISARCIGHALAHMPVPPTRWLVCGGGRKNAHMMGLISKAVGIKVEPVEAVGLDGDFLEAQAFAWLAIRVLRGLATSAQGTTGCTAPVSGGQISRA